MIKNLIIVMFFCIVAAAMKPMPRVEEITKVNKIYCKDLCR
jgi:hypothetical protein